MTGREPRQFVVRDDEAGIAYVERPEDPIL
jgi:hypothetical protein